MIKRICSIKRFIATALMSFCCLPMVCHAIEPNPNTPTYQYSYYNMDSVGNTVWRDKFSIETKVYVNPTEGPALIYTVQGGASKNATTGNNRSTPMQISSGEKIGITNDFILSGEIYARLYLQRTVTGQVYTRGLWNPDALE
ncbi:MAG: hypothetical protein IKL22_12055 [Lachnospiraceae bacterium]|nr:hypothetical protein [Lachnospiraceae bacterium]